MEISQIVNAIFGSLTNIIAAIVITAGLALALFGTFKSSSHKFIRHFAKQSPSILATVGIFFSFWGISIGLIGLDLNDIQNSIPKLLDGLKVKFIASLMGIGASIIVRIAQNFAVEDDGDVIDDYSAAIFQELKNQNELLARIDSNNKEHFELLNYSINTGFKNQIQKFDEFAQSVTKGGVEALIEALQDVMRDFNAKINEQFGDNFKELNHAVGDLLEWQKNYKIHVEQLNSNFQNALKGITDIQNAFGQIQNHSQNFVVVSNELGEILKQLDSQLQGFNHHLQTLDELAHNAKNAFPVIENNLNELTNGFKTSVEKSLFDINSSVEAVTKSLIQSSSKIESLDKALPDAVEKVLQTMGDQLARLSTKFVNDYTPLTERLREILQIAERVR
jgi:septation ring formation regulator EzrA